MAEEENKYVEVKKKSGDINTLTSLKLAELSALATAVSFVCGAAYDAAYFNSFNSRLFDLLSVHDHISSSISFLPPIVAYVTASQLFAPLFLMDKTRQNLYIILSHHFLRWIPRLHKRIVIRNTIRIAAITVVENLKEDVKNTKPDEFKKMEEKEKSDFLMRLIISIFIIGIFTYFMYFSVNSPWSLFTVFLSVILTELLVVLFVALYQIQLSFSFMLLIILLPLIVGTSACFGFSNAIRTVASRDKNAMIYTSGRLDDSSTLMRAIDSGLIVYNHNTNHVVYYPWREVDRLEIRRRPW